MTNFDKIDLKILEELDFNARIPFTQLAKKINLNKKTTEFRVKKLEKNKIILGYYPQINVSKFNVLYSRLFITLQNISKEEKKEMTTYLKNHKKVFWLFSTQGKYDLGVGCLCNSPFDFKNLIKEINQRYSEFIKNINESFATKLYSLNYNFIQNKKQIIESNYSEENNHKDINELDIQILKKLSINARKSLVEIANELNTTAKVVAYRINKLKKEEIIQSYRTIFNYNKLNLAYYKILINLSKKDENTTKQLKKYLFSHPIVIYYVEGIGISHDLDIEILVKSNSELFNFIEELRFNFPKIINEFETIGFTQNIKTNFVPEL